MIKHSSRMLFVYTALLFFILYGFYPFTSIFEKIGIYSSTPSYAYRIIVLSITLILLFKVEVPKYKNTLFLVSIISGLLFFFLYSFRLAYDVSYQSESLSKPIFFYLMFFYFVCILPALSGIVLQKNCDFSILAKISYFISAFFFLLIILNYLSSQSLVENLSLRLHTDKANPIAISHYAGSIFIIACLVFITRLRDVPRVISAFYILVSFCIMLLTGSRGPLLATAFSLCLYFFIANKINTRILLIIISLIVVGYFSDLIYVSYFSAESVFTRFTSTAGVNDQASHLRLISFLGGIEQFSNNPLIGDLIEVRVTNYYPHNIFIESFMSTGIFGGVCFSLYFILCLFMSFKLMRYDALSVVFSIWFVKYLIGAQFSSAIYTMNELWMLSIIILFRYQYIKSEISKL